MFVTSQNQFYVTSLGIFPFQHEICRMKKMKLENTKLAEVTK